MTSPDTDDGGRFEKFVERLRRGDQRAQEELYERHASKLLAVAAHRLSFETTRVRARVDREGVVQWVFFKFDEHLRKGKFVLRDERGLAGLLRKMTVRRCRYEADRLRCQARDVRRESALDDPSPLSFPQQSRESLPEDGVITDEVKEGLVSAFVGPVKKEIARLVLEGWSYPKISIEAGCSETAVVSVARAIRRRLEESRGCA